MNRKTSIIILTYNNLEYTKRCIKSIEKYTEKDTYEVIVVDNNSTDGTKEWLKQKHGIKLILNSKNAGFPKGCNQGIMYAKNDNDILLLNNDTIVTNNWLKNLKICLYSAENIGAVGAVCNHDENRQGVEFNYNDIEQMQRLATINNHSDSSRWEEKVFLIGFCLLMKRSVVDGLKGLDVKFTPGYVEDNDLSLRIVNLGYKLILCHDCFIHHYLGTTFRKNLDEFYPILYRNRNYFYKKWGFDTFSFDDVKSASLPLIQNPKNVLELNCGIGTTILTLKYKFKNIEIEGVEKKESKRLISSKFAKVYDKLKNSKRKYYDYILIGNLLEKIKNPVIFLKKIKRYLKPNGYLVGEISNSTSIKKINLLLNGNCYEVYKNQSNLFNIYDLKKLFEKCNYKNFKLFSWYENISTNEKLLLKKIQSQDNNFYFTYYTFKVMI